MKEIITSSFNFIQNCLNCDFSNNDKKILTPTTMIHQQNNNQNINTNNQSNRANSISQSKRSSNKNIEESSDKMESDKMESDKMSQNEQQISEKQSLNNEIDLKNVEVEVSKEKLSIAPKMPNKFTIVVLNQMNENNGVIKDLNELKRRLDEIYPMKM